MKKKVAMIGVGKLGEPCAEAMSEYHDVVGYDVLPRTPKFPIKESIQEENKENWIDLLGANREVKQI